MNKEICRDTKADYCPLVLMQSRVLYEGRLVTSLHSDESGQSISLLPGVKQYLLF